MEWTPLGVKFAATIVLAAVASLLVSYRRIARGRELLLEAQREIVNLRRANSHLTALSFVDPLTEIANRRAFEDALKREHSRMLRNGSSLSLVYIDVDHFKSLNDTLGHPRGDVCLKMIANELRQCAKRPADLSARIGGEEFAILLPETDVAGAIQVAESAKKAVENLHLENPGSPRSPFLTISLGVASSNGDPSNLIRMADQALYAAKQAGRNRVFATIANPVESIPIRRTSATHVREFSLQD